MHKLTFALASPVTIVTATATTTALLLAGCSSTPCAMATARRWQSAFGRGSRFGSPPSSSSTTTTTSAGAAMNLPPRVTFTGPATPAPVYRVNSTLDDELSPATRAAMRDDAIILSAIFRNIPQGGAITVKSLSSQLPPDVQEALSEKHGGLRAFLEQRKQFFVVKPRPEDGVLFVAANPLAAQKFAVRELQQNTMRQMLGLPREGEEDDHDRRPRGNGRRSAGDRDGRNPDAGGNGNHQERSRGYAGDREGPGGFAGGNRRPRDGPMGGREQNFGARTN